MDKLRNRAAVALPLYELESMESPAFFPSIVGLSLQQGLHIGGLERKPSTNLTGRVVEGSRDRRSRKGVGRF